MSTNSRVDLDPYTVNAIAAYAHDLWAVPANATDERPARPPAWINLREDEQESERATVRAVLYAVLDQGLPDGAGKAEAELLLAAKKAAAVHPGLLRWCDWPGCFAHFHAIDGPGESGWMRHRSVMMLLCPEHEAAGHMLSFDWDVRLRDAPMEAICSCGESAEVTPKNIEAVRAWWREHVTQVPAAVAP